MADYEKILFQPVFPTPAIDALPGFPLTFFLRIPLPGGPGREVITSKGSGKVPL
ncbi:hypothetical protein JAO76_16505 [Pontibacter sp. BT310]|uniref:Uncharacterized protein n=1 Tax=Pontibacter populi TaxID=890055 RepID=A0ABS6XGH6_9BACT|nr:MULTISPECIES: hypothetical protein [Pontibacter]MBJ6119810.1 hypothetical protein [Pontibacter sp. BT310]MBR0572239.1 hypothetical protein [Microvirga sp. STS03]MBW3366663.1 hypothetical protein [Pontibacter populi]